jgi:flagellar biosynthesis GTPase FlhF
VALKGRLKSEEEIPAGLEDYYQMEDGEYRLKVTGLVEKSVVDEFRNNNIKLQNELAELSKKISGVDFEEYNTLRAEKDAQRDKKLIEEGKVEELIADRVQRMHHNFEKEKMSLQEQLEQLNSQANTYKRKYDDSIVEQKLINAAARAGVRNEATTDVLNRAKQIWQNSEDGDLIAMQGENHLYSKDGRKPLQVEEWFESLADEAPHLFKNSEGSGALGGRGGPAGRRVSLQDQAGLNANLEDIAAGKVQVF